MFARNEKWGSEWNCEGRTEDDHARSGSGEGKMDAWWMFVVLEKNQRREMGLMELWARENRDSTVGRCKGWMEVG